MINHLCSDGYEGSKPFSEIETKSMSKYIESISDKFYAYIAFHSHAQMLLFPYGHTKAHLDNYDELVSNFVIAIKIFQKILDNIFLQNIIYIYALLSLALLLKINISYYLINRIHLLIFVSKIFILFKDSLIISI